ncbi:hypothetical protein EI200_11820 [Peribacillus simplex]|uniref:ABC-three component system middle component 4 n=1 Tax=Peribacillus simplex TaxID=1478 RepID=UPI000F6343CA|nr:ABC-three component system middle component 4 [Peribacillus simplex]RRN71136.1 hypothetical protein EI200_11820 [Peribacillus simplex]
MNKKVPFIIPENDLGFRITRLLILIGELGLNKNKKPLLTLEKVAIFDFLLKNPFILDKVLVAEGKIKGIVLDETETGSIESQYPNIINLFDYGSIRGYIQLLVSFNLIEVVTVDSYLYITSEKGKEIIDKLSSTHISRIKELSKAMIVLRNMSSTQLVKKIKPFVKGI